MECVRMGGIFHDFSVEEGGFPELSRSVFSGRITVSGKIELLYTSTFPVTSSGLVTRQWHLRNSVEHITVPEKVRLDP